MSKAPFDISQTKQLEIKRKVWLDTFYYTFPYNILDFDPNLNYSYPCRREKPLYLDTVFDFEIRRLSELQFRMIFSQTPVGYLMTPGEYAFQFLCDTNFFDEDPKIITELHSNQSETHVDFWLTASYRKDIFMDYLKKRMEFKIVVYMIEYDEIYPSDIGYYLEELRKTNQVFHNESVLTDLCYILEIQRLEDVFAGRLNTICNYTKKRYISKIATLTKEILNYLESKNGSSSVTNLELLLSNLLKNKERLTDEDLLGLYFDSNYLGLTFSVDLSREFLLHRLSEYQISNTSDYDYLLLVLLKATVHVTDECLFEKCAKMLHGLKNERLANFSKNLEACIHNRFVLHSLKRRLKKYRIA